jgi:hypothetical protein
LSQFLQRSAQVVIPDAARFCGMMRKGIEDQRTGVRKNACSVADGEQRADSPPSRPARAISTASSIVGSHILGEQP